MKQGIEKPLSDTQAQFCSTATQSELPPALAKNKPNSNLKQSVQFLCQAICLSMAIRKNQNSMCILHKHENAYF